MQRLNAGTYVYDLHSPFSITLKLVALITRIGIFFSWQVALSNWRKKRPNFTKWV